MLPASNSTTLRDLEAKTDSAARAALQLAQEYEAGQAETPLYDGLKRLCSPLTSEPIRIVLAGFDPAATAEALAALAGQDCNVCRVVLMNQLGLTEVSLQERGFGVESGTFREEFDTVEPFVAALQRLDPNEKTSATAKARDWLDPIRFRLPVIGNRAGLSLLIPDSIRSLLTRPALLSALAERADWLFVAGSASNTPAREELDILQVLAGQLRGLQCLVTPAEGSSTLPPAGWWQQISGSVAFPPLTLGTPAAEQRLFQFTDPAGSLRAVTLEARRLRSVQSMLHVLTEEITQSLDTLRGKRRLYESETLAAKVAGTNPSMRRAAESLRVKLQDDLDATLATIVEEGKRALVPDSPTMKRVRELTAGVEAKDLERVLGEEKIKLALSSEKEEQLCAEIRTLGKEHLLQDLELVHQSLEASVTAISQEFTQSTGLSRRLSVDFPDSRALWESILTLVRPEIKYRGEMQRPTLGARLSAARQSIMTLLMAGTLMGGSLALFGIPNLRNMLLILALPLFVIGFVWTFFSFKKQEKLNLERETDKLREGLIQELRRVLMELYREEQNRLTQFFGKTARDLNTQLGELFRAVEESETQSREQSRKQAVDLNRNLEGTLKLLEKRLHDAQKISQSISEPERTAQTLLAQTIATAS